MPNKHNQILIMDNVSYKSQKILDLIKPGAVAASQDKVHFDHDSISLFFKIYNST